MRCELLRQRRKREFKKNTFVLLLIKNPIQFLGHPVTRMIGASRNSHKAVILKHKMIVSSENFLFGFGGRLDVSMTM